MLAAIATIACFTLNSCEKDGEEINVLFKFKFSNAVKEIDDKNTIFAKKGITITIHYMDDNSDVASYIFEK